MIIKKHFKQNKFLTWKSAEKQESREKLLNQNKIKELLATHISTKERLHFYPELKKIISKLKPKSVLDIACGLNPIALADKKTIYYASDIKKPNLNLIKKFFKKNKIKGKVFSHDLKNQFNILPKADLCLLFKVLDIIEKNPYPLTKKLITELNCKYILISFSTKTLSGKTMKNPKRIWLRRLLKKLSLKYEVFFSENEIFYLVTKFSSSL